jgi:hypothetical protein
MLMWLYSGILVRGNAFRGCCSPPKAQLLSILINRRGRSPDVHLDESAVSGRSVEYPNTPRQICQGNRASSSHAVPATCL